MLLDACIAAAGAEVGAGVKAGVGSGVRVKVGAGVHPKTNLDVSSKGDVAPALTMTVKAVGTGEAEAKAEIGQRDALRVGVAARVLAEIAAEIVAGVAAEARAPAGAAAGAGRGARTEPARGGAKSAGSVKKVTRGGGS